MRIRASRTLVFVLDEGTILGFNFLTQTSFTCTSDLLYFLSMLSEWTEERAISKLVPTLNSAERDSTIRELLHVHALIEKHSLQDHSEKDYCANWKWSTPAAIFHFSVQNRIPMSLEEMEKLQLEKLEGCSQPPLFRRHDAERENVVPLPDAVQGNNLLQIMARRRTVREARLESISLNQLSDCLFAGLGITGETQNCAGRLPLSMTPSGGARNPYEAYVYAREVDGLPAGFYHYSPFDHSLSCVGTNLLPAPSELLGNQDWVDGMPCVIFLCAFFERTMWKYEDANAYRVVLIEAGHIGQNIMLAATHHGLSACPSAALNQTEINRCVMLDQTVLQCPIYALTLGIPEENAMVPELAAAS